LATLNEIGGVYLVEPRVSVQWGDVSQLDALLGCITYALEKLDFSWLSVISGQDYPIRPLKVSEAELRNTSYDAFVKAARVENGPYRTRYYLRYRPLPRFRYAYRLPRQMLSAMAWLRRQFNQRQSLLKIEGSTRGLPPLLGIRTLRHPYTEQFVCYKGSDWFTLSRPAATALIEFGLQQPGILKHYRKTFIPSESYFQTVLWNNKNLYICNDNRRFIVWQGTSIAHPKTLTVEDLDAMTRSGKDFGRKFDATSDSTVLDELDLRVLGRD
jgi:hypothetical protein